MTINEVKNTIKKHLYIVFKENFTSDSNTFIERYVAKHPLLKPELIVINDQIQGFKKASKKVSSLEDFPIFLEIEGLLNDEESCYIDGIDLYAEANVNCQKRLSDIIYLSKMYAQHVSLERVLELMYDGLPRPSRAVTAANRRPWKAIVRGVKHFKTRSYSEHLTR